MRALRVAVPALLLLALGAAGGAPAEAQQRLTASAAAGSASWKTEGRSGE